MSQSIFVRHAKAGRHLSKTPNKGNEGPSNPSCRLTPPRIFSWVVFLFLSMLSINAASVNLAWDPSEFADGYKVYWGTASRVYGPPMDVGNVTTATVTHLTNTYTYFFAVTAYNTFGESDFSSEVSVTIPPLSAPEYLAMYPGIFTWSIPWSSDVMTGFHVYRKSPGVIGPQVFTVSDPEARSLAMTDLIPTLTYQFWVKSFIRVSKKKEITSPPSEVFTWVVPSAPYAGEPKMATAMLLENGKVRVIFYGTPYRLVQIQASDDLTEWVTLGTATEFDLGRFRFDDSMQQQRFYRAIQ